MQSASSSSLSFTESVISDLSCQILLLISSYPLLCCPARVTATLYSSIYLTLKAQIVLLTLFFSGQRRASPLLHELLWLPVRAHIDYMIATLCYCCLRGLTPEGQGDRCLATWVAACLCFMHQMRKIWQALLLWPHLELSAPFFLNCMFEAFKFGFKTNL